MKKFIQFVSASVVGLSMMAGVAAADTTCTINNTGAGSVNNCTDDNNVSVEATCVNNVYVDNRNIQGATTGNGTVTLNTNGGGATSGDATNSNNDVVAIGASCAGGVTTVAATTPTTTETPAGGKGGETATVTPAATPAPAAAALPETGSNTVVDVAVAGVTILGGAVAASQIGSFAYRRLAVK